MSESGSPHKPNRPPCPEENAFLDLWRTADILSRRVAQVLKSEDLSPTQYNVLRILRGAQPGGLACRAIGDRMISHDPDMTRLLDRMEKRGLIRRERQKDDRRVVKTHITSQGLELLKPLDRPMRELHKRQFRHMPATRVKNLVELLEEICGAKPQ
jgi:MarR family transcriptional regulator, organic hydroperoxide resistance regulator